MYNFGLFINFLFFNGSLKNYFFLENGFSFILIHKVDAEFVFNLSLFLVSGFSGWAKDLGASDASND